MLDKFTITQPAVLYLTYRAKQLILVSDFDFFFIWKYFANWRCELYRQHELVRFHQLICKKIFPPPYAKLRKCFQKQM